MCMYDDLPKECMAQLESKRKIVMSRSDFMISNTKSLNARESLSISSEYYYDNIVKLKINTLCVSVMGK